MNFIHDFVQNDIPYIQLTTNAEFKKSEIKNKYEQVLFYKPKSKTSTYYVSDFIKNGVFLISFNGSKELHDNPELLIAVNTSQSDFEFNISQNFFHIQFMKLIFTDFKEYKYKFKTWDYSKHRDKNIEYINGLFRCLNVPKHSVWLWEII